MNAVRLFSRSLVVAIISIGTMSAVIDFKDVKHNVQKHQFTFLGTVASDHFAAKNEHSKKAFIETVGHSFDKHRTTKEGMGHNEFAEHLALNYSIRKGKELLGARGLAVDKKAILKKMDVLPDGIARDLVNPVVEGAVEVATHPETWTLAAMYIIHQVILPALQDKKSS